MDASGPTPLRFRQCRALQPRPNDAHGRSMRAAAQALVDCLAIEDSCAGRAASDSAPGRGQAIALVPSPSGVVARTVKPNQRRGACTPQRRLAGEIPTLAIRRIPAPREGEASASQRDRRTGKRLCKNEPPALFDAPPMVRQAVFGRLRYRPSQSNAIQRTARHNTRNTVSHLARKPLTYTYLFDLAGINEARDTCNTRNTEKQQVRN